MPDLVDEVDEELRAERAQKLAQRYGGVVAGVMLLAVAGVGGWEGWRWYEGRQAAAAAQTFLTAAQQAAADGADMREAAQRFGTIAADAPAGYRALARLREASLLAEAGDVPAALAAWDRLARDEGVDRLYRDLATVMWGLHAVDATDPGQVEARIAPLAAAGAPWRATAREVLALAQL
ncbi:MAG: tetratricopeptide repeat protein, partial [Acetobacteraceae bacterium]|nr:tetratricopeptide repeat protein [Acetobacteraceae bacterium]